MPSTKEHRDKAAHNEFLVSTLDNPFWDWAIIGTFYAALHHIEAYLATKGIHGPTHPIRDSHIQRDANLKAIYVDYRELENESRDARYDVIEFKQADVRRLQGNLETIKKVILPLI